MAFNRPLHQWNTARVTSMKNMFRNAHVFDQDVSSWNVANVQDMTGMFHGAKHFSQLICWKDLLPTVQIDDAAFEGTADGAGYEDPSMCQGGSD